MKYVVPGSIRVGRAGATAAAFAIALVLPGSGMAQAWKPQQQVEIIVGSAAGSSPDTMARMIQRIWQEKKMIDVPATVMNRVGGGNTKLRGVLGDLGLLK